jgi:hypothetical protein
VGEGNVRNQLRTLTGVVGVGRGRGFVLCIWSSISIIAVAEDGTTRDQEEYAEKQNYRSSQPNLPVT